MNVQGFVDPYPCPTCTPQDKQPISVSDESPEIEFPRTVEKIYADIDDYFNRISNHAFTNRVFHADDIDSAEKVASIILDNADKILVSIQELKTLHGGEQIPYESVETDCEVYVAPTMDDETIEGSQQHPE